MADRASHLSLIIDLSPTQWHRSADPSNPYPLPLKTFLSQLLAFVNSHIACKHENTLAVFGAFPGKSVRLYASTDPTPETAPKADSNSYTPFKVVDSTVTSRIADEFDSLAADEEEAPTALVGALTKALCYINRVASPTSAASDDPATILDPRILILSVSPDPSTMYIPIMNSIFSAQKLKVSIDVCQMFGPETVFLQQAAHLTGGSYIYLERRDALLQYLVMAFLPSPSIRKTLSVPTQDKVDLRATCFCHQNIVDIGFVCSVCLSIFCQPVPVCSTCRTKFPIKTLQRLNASKPASPAPARLPSVLPSSNSINTLPSSSSIGTNGAGAGAGSPNGKGRPSGLR